MFQERWKNGFDVIELAFSFATIHVERFLWRDLQRKIFNDVDEAFHLFDEVVNVKYVCETADLSAKI